MNHLSPDALARLVDESPSTEERGHLNRCRICREELDALRTQRLALSHLPPLRPPAGDWDRLEPRLRTEGLLRNPAGSGFAARPWLQAAAAILLIVTGVGLGAWLPFDRDRPGPLGTTVTASSPTGGSTGETPASILTAMADPDRELTLEEAGELVQLIERWYLQALLEYRERAEVERGVAPEDPLTRFAALETLMAASQAAVRELPADPFLNGLLVNMHAEREATLRGIQASYTRDWY